MAGTSNTGAADRWRASSTQPAALPEPRDASDRYAGTARLPDEERLLTGVDVVEGDDEASFTVLERQTCFNLLDKHSIGRVAFTIEGDAAPTILPVSYAMVSGTIVFRSALAGAIMRHVRGYAAFQADQFDEDRREGWGVLASGPCRWVRDTDELSRIPQGRLPQPWAEGRRDQVLKITPDRVTGRQVSRS